MHMPLFISSKTTPRLALGTWALGGGKDWGEVPSQQAQALLQEALESGLRWIDTSPVYGWGEAEERIGQILRPWREKVILSGKCGICLNEQNRPDHDLRPQQVVRECEASLKRLQTDYLDLYQLHWPDPNTPLEDTLQALLHLKQQGKIRALGLCNFPLDLLKKACQMAPIECVQYQLSLLAGVPTDILQFCQERQIVFLGYGVLGGGILSGKYQKEPNFKRGDARKYFYRYYTAERFLSAQETAARVKQVARQKGVCASAVALAWGLVQQGVSGVLFGARNSEQVRQNLQALQVELTTQEQEFLQHG